MSQPTTGIYLNKTTPAAPSGEQNVVFQSDNGTPQQRVTAYDPVMVGDTGSGGQAGNVPAPPAGSAAAHQFLRADGTWASPGAGGGGLAAPVLLQTGTPTTYGLAIEAAAGTQLVPAFVQQNSGSLSSGAASVAVAFPSNVAAGDAILVTVASNNFSFSAPSSVTDSAGNTYTLIETAGGFCGLWLYMASNVAGGATTVTVSWGSNQANIYVAIAEYANVSGVLDASASGGGAWGASTSAGATITTTGVADLLFTACLSVDTLIPAAPPTGCTQRADVVSLQIADETNVTAGTYTATWTFPGQCQYMMMFVVALSAPAQAQQSANLLQFESAASTVLSAVNGQGQIVLPSTAGMPSNTPTEGALAYNSAAGQVALFTSAGWSAIGGGGGGASWLNVVNPAVVSFSWLNQGPATENVGSASRFLLAAPVAGDQIRGRQVAASAPPFSATAGLIPLLQNQNYNQCGLYVSDGTKIVSLSISVPNTLAVYHWNNSSSFNSNVLTPNAFWEITPVFLKIFDDGTTLNFSWSPDGTNFIQVYSEARLSFLSSVSDYGIYANANNTQYSCGVLLISWETGTS